MHLNGIVDWIGYWDRAHMVAFHEINSVADMAEARKYCSCMRTGIFTESEVSTEELWNALLAYRRRKNPLNRKD